jgi:hypothetical protein
MGPDFVDQYRQAGGYVDRILTGETERHGRRRPTRNAQPMSAFGGKADIEAPSADDATRRANRLSTR